LANSFLLTDPATRSDLEKFLNRAKKLDSNGAVRLKAFGEVLTATVAPIYNSSILGNDPTILGMRVAKLSEPSDGDVVASLGSILERLAGKDLELSWPPSREVVPWAGISPPQSGWEHLGEISAIEISEIAKAGIEEVAASVPQDTGANLVQRVRSNVWGRSFGEFGLPQGVCFGLVGLGFLENGQEVKVYANQNWRRLSSSFGHVLTKLS
jgi:hypothetical protein